MGRYYVFSLNLVILYSRIHIYIYIYIMFISSIIKVTFSHTLAKVGTFAARSLFENVPKCAQFRQANEKKHCFLHGEK